MAREQQFIDDLVLSGAITSVSSKQVVCTPTYPHQPGRATIICISWYGIAATTADITSVLVGGAAATLIGEANGSGARAAMYRFMNTPKVAFNVDVAWTDPVNGSICVYLVEQVDQASPIKASNTNSGTGTSSSIALGTVEAQEYAISCFAQFNATTTTNTTTTAPLVNDQNNLAGASPERLRGVHASGTGSGGALTATHTPAASKPFGHVACVLRAAQTYNARMMTGAGL